MKKIVAPLFFALLAAAAAIAQPGPPPSGWSVSGSTVSTSNSVLLPRAVTGGAQGVGTINASGLFRNGNAVAYSFNGRFGAITPATSDYAFSQISGTLDLTSQVAGVLPISNGGTGFSGSGTSGGIPYFNSATTLASSGLLTNHAIILGGGAGAAPVSLGSLGTSTTILHGNASGAPTWGSVVLTTDVSGILPYANGGTGVGSYTTNGILYAGTSAFASTAALTDGQLIVGQTSAAPLPKTVSGDATLVASGALTLATVNSNVGSFTSASITVNAKGLITAASSGAAVVPFNYKAGLALSPPGSSSTFGIAAGSASDTTNAAIMSLATAYTKTTGAWAVGSGNGSLDVGTIAAASWYYDYLIERTDTGVVDVLTSLAPGSSSTVTISNASPGVITWTNNGLQANAPVKFSTTGALPTGLTAGTQYYVKTVISVRTFSVSATQGGTAINTSSAGSGTQTASALPILPSPYTLYRFIGAFKTDGSSYPVCYTQTANTVELCASVSDVNAATPVGGTAYAQALASVPPGIVVAAGFRGYSGAVSGISGGAAVLFTGADEGSHTYDSPTGNRSAGESATAAGGLFYAWDLWKDTDTAQNIWVSSDPAASNTPNLIIATHGWRYTSFNQ